MMLERLKIRCWSGTEPLRRVPEVVGGTVEVDLCCI
jgi:hypothetical protein